jgi:ABC-type phosphate transport system substrate-binding protein
MNKIEVFPNSTLRISKYNRRAVSDVVAVLILIVIAIIGAVAVGLILTTSSHSVGAQVATQGNGNSATQNLYIGGSTTIYPVTQDAAATFESTYHINIIDAQGGSGGGMQGLIDGALDIGAASSLAAVYSAVTYVAANSLVGVNLQAFQIGGSGVVPIMTSTATGAAISGTAPLTTGFITDGTPNTCEDVSAAAFTAMYTDGEFWLSTTSCTSGAGGIHTLSAANVYASATAAGTGAIGPYLTISRADNSGTADTWAGWLGVSPSTYPLLASAGATGNPGLLTAVQDCGKSGTLTTGSFPTGLVGCVGYVDLGFAEGAVSGLSCGSGWTASTPCGVSIPQTSSNDGTGIDALAECTTSAPSASSDTGSCYAPFGVTTSGLHTAILNALKLFSNANPYLNSGYTVQYPDTSAKSTGLVKVFYYVTNGTPTPTEQTFINFMLSPNAQPFFNDNGYFAWVQYAAA